MLAERTSSTSPLRQMMRSLSRREKMSAGEYQYQSMLKEGRIIGV